MGEPTSNEPDRTRAHEPTPSPGLAPPGVITATDALLAAGPLRREPFRILFPLGVVLAWAGVLHWLLYALGLLAEFRPVFHAMTQIQGFMMCFAVGFLFTMIPRRTGSAPPATWQLAVATTAPVATVVFAWHQQWAAAQIAWLVLAATVVGFAVSRFVSGTARRRPPNSFVWIPASLLMGVIGSILTGAFGVLGPGYQWTHDVGRGLLLQGMFTGLVLGVGGLALPLMTRGVAPDDAAATAADRRSRLLHVCGALLLAASFAIGYQYSLRAGYGLRAAVVVAALVFGAELWRLPVGEGRNRRLIWLAAWMLPCGYVLAALFPLHHKAGLHVVFIGGFALLALAVSTQVTLGHGNYRELLFGRPWQLAVMATLVGCAIVPRALMELDPGRYSVWMAAAAALFLAGTIVWGAFLGPKLVPRR